MSKRLELIASKVQNGIGVADVGTDHAYIPVMLRRNGYKGRIVATDINSGPLEKARRGLLEAGCMDSVELVLCDGLDGCEPDSVDCIIAAGMGGDTITGIIDRAEWTYREGIKLILQPVTKAEILRYWLVNNQYRITDEELVKENGTIYQVICAELGDPIRYSDAELFVGKYENISTNKLFTEYIDQYIIRFSHAVEGLSNAQRTGLSSWLKINENILSELTEMRGRKNDC